MKELSAKQIANECSLIGRFIPTSIRNREALYTTNLGAIVKMKVENCTFFSVHFLNNGNPFGPAQRIAIRVDLDKWRRFSVAEMPVILQLSPVSHLIEIMTVGNSDLDEVWNGEQGFALEKICLSEDARVEKVKPRFSVTFIGDSITAGCWINGRSASVDYAAEQNYVAVCSDQLGLDSTRIAYSAAGIMRPGTGGVPNAFEFIRQIDQNHPFGLPVADLVVINIGVNDRRYERDDFKIQLTKFLKLITNHYPDIPVAVMIPFAQTFAPIFRSVASEFNNIELIETKNWKLSYTDGLHPDERGSLIAGHNLAEQLSTYIK